MSWAKTLSKKKQIPGLFGWLILVFSASALGAIASISANDFYQELIRPSWAPPGWVFGPVWSTLFAMMGISAWLVWRENGFAKAGGPLSIFLCQLAVNALWSWLFFAWRLGSIAFAEILLLWLLIVATIFLFWRVSKIAALLLGPYLAWVSFAAVLNYSVWQLNPALLG